MHKEKLVIFIYLATIAFSTSSLAETAANTKTPTQVNEASKALPSVELLLKASEVESSLVQKLDSRISAEPLWLILTVNSQKGLSGLEFRAALAKQNGSNWSLGPILTFRWDCDDHNSMSLDLDKMVFKIAPDHNAFGVRASVTTNTQTVSGSSTDLILFVVDKQKLNSGLPILRNIFQSNIEDSSVADKGTTGEPIKRNLQISPQKHDGYFDLTLKAKGEAPKKFQWATDAYFEIAK